MSHVPVLSGVSDRHGAAHASTETVMDDGAILLVIGLVLFVFALSADRRE